MRILIGICTIYKAETSGIKVPDNKKLSAPIYLSLITPNELFMPRLGLWGTGSNTIFHKNIIIILAEY